MGPRPPCLLWCLAAACADALPLEVEGYASRCVHMNPAPLPEAASDPHRGVKEVYACGVEASALAAAPPYPEGTLIVKESRREGQAYPWLVAIAEKRDGRWHWAEYTRNFEGETFLQIGSPEKVCTGCHRRVESQDWIYTGYAP